MTEQKLPVIAKKAPFKVQVEPGQKYFWCACGLSKNQPFCDGSHKGTGIKSTPYEADESKMVYFCGCKYSKNGVFCDGSHNDLK